MRSSTAFPPAFPSSTDGGGPSQARIGSPAPGAAARAGCATEPNAMNRLRLALVVLLATGLLLLGGMSFVRRVQARAPTIGVQWAQSTSGPFATDVAKEGAAFRAGLRPGDLVVALDGRPIRKALELEARIWEANPDRALRLTVHRGSAVAESIDIPIEFRGSNEPYVYLALVGLAFWVSGVFIATRWPDIRGGLVYPLLGAAMFARLTSSPSGRADEFDWVCYWVDLISGALAPALLFHVGVALTKRALKIRRPAVGLAYLISGLLILASIWLSPAAFGGALIFDDPRRWIEFGEPLEFAFLGLSLMATITLLFKSRAGSSSAMHRGQMKWLLWGLAGGLGPFVLLYALPWALGAPALPLWAQFLSVAPMLLVPAAFTAALARYRLHDLDLLLVRALIEVAAVFCTFAVLAGVVFLVREGLGGIFGLSHSGARYIGFLVAAIAYPQVRAGLRIAVEKAFYRKRYSYRATLLDWARELNAETDLPALIGHLRTRVRDTLGVATAEVLLRADGGRFVAMEGTPPAAVTLDSQSVARLEGETSLSFDEGEAPGLAGARHLFPLRVKGTLRAVLAVGERGAGGEPLTSEDRALLATLAAHAGTAIEAARLVQEVRRRAEEIERLHEREARILESSAVGLLLSDADGKILAWNRALEQIHGLPRNNAVGRALGDVLPPHVARKISEQADSGLDEGDRRSFRLAMTNNEGRRIMLNIAVSPVADGGHVVSFDDVTSRVMLEQQLSQQERLAALGLLAAGVAHEINTPLTGVSSYVQMLLEDCAADDPRRALLTRVDEQAMRASNIAGSLLNFARPDRSTLETIDLNDAVREALALFEPQRRGRAIELVSILDSELPRVRGHRVKLQQVLLNLLLNARDAIGDRGQVIVRTEGSGDWVRLSVEDDGHGIPEADLERIFDPFFTTKRRDRGTGLGLSVSYGIIEEHDGKIRVDSTPGERTRFQIELPSASAVRASA